MVIVEVLDAVLVGQDEGLHVGDLDLGGRPAAAVGVRAGVAALAQTAVLEVPIPVRRWNYRIEGLGEISSCYLRAVP